MKGRGKGEREAAESMAIQALSYIASDGERLSRFLALTGIGPDEIRSAAAQPGFLIGVLEYLASDEALMIGFAAGAIAAALMTPKTGKQMRRELKRKASDLRDRVDEWTDQAGDFREKAAEFAGKAQDWADAAKERVGPLAKKFRS